MYSGCIEDKGDNKEPGEGGAVSNAGTRQLGGLNPMSWSKESTNESKIGTIEGRRGQ